MLRRLLPITSFLVMTLATAGSAQVSPELEALREKLRSAEVAVRVQAATELNARGARSAPALHDLAAALADREPAVRMLCAGALAKMGPQARAAVPQLIAALKDGDPGVRTAAAEALGSLGDVAEAAMPQLRGLLNDPDREVRRQAGWAADRVARAVAARPVGVRPERGEHESSPEGEAPPPNRPREDPEKEKKKPTPKPKPPEKPKPTSVADWIGLLSDSDPEVRFRAAGKLGVFGPQAAEALPALEKLRNDPVPKVRRAVLRAINRIRGVKTRHVVGTIPEVKNPPKITGRLYYFPLHQVPTEEGPKPVAELPSVNEFELQVLPVFVYLDFEEVEAFREELRRSGSADAGLSLAELAKKYPKKILHPYLEAFAARLIWQGQTTYKFIWWKHQFVLGQGQLIGYTPGKHETFVSIITSEGLRIDDVLGFRIDPPEQKAVDRLKSQRESLEYALEKLADPLPPESEYVERRSAERWKRDFRRDLGHDYRRIAGSLIATGLGGADEVASHLEAALKAEKVVLPELRADPDLSCGLWLTFTGEDCMRLGTARGYRVALELARIAETEPEVDTTVGQVGVATAHACLGHLAVSSGCDVWAGYDHWEKSLLAHNRACPDDRKEMPPRPEWAWWEEWCEPVEPVEGEEDPGGDPTADQPEEDVAEGEDEDSAADPEDEERARAIRWLSSIDDAFADAERKVATVRAELAIQRIAAAKIREKIKQLQLILSTAKTGDEDLFDSVTKAWDELWDQPPPKEPDAAMRQIVEQRIKELRGQLAEVLKQQDRSIAEVGEAYDRILDEMEARGGKLEWEDVKATIASFRERATKQQEVTRLELNLASGQRRKFQAAARHAIDQGGSLVTVARLMQGLDHVENKDYRSALQALRECLQSDPENKVAEKLVRDLEVGYLKAIDAKAMGDAAAVRKAVWDRLSAHGEKGWWGAIKDVCTTGVISSIGAISGDMEAMGEEAGTIMSEAARDHAGLLIIARLREKGLTLDEIKGLTNENFVATVQEHFKPGVPISAEHAMKMRAAIHRAFQNTDAKRLAAGSKLQLDVDTGRSYFDTEVFKESWGEWIGDGINVKNLAIMLGPMAAVKAGGKTATVAYWGAVGGKAPTSIVTAKDAFAGMLRLPSLAEKLNQSKIGQQCVAQLMKFDETTGLVSHMVVDALVQQGMMRAGKALGGDAGEFIAEVLTAYGVGDYDVAVKMLKSTGVRSTHVRALTRQLSSSLQEADDIIVRGQRLLAPVNEVLDDLVPGGKLGKATRQMLDDADEQISVQLQRLSKSIDAGEASPLMVHEARRLQTARQMIEAAKGGQPFQAKAYREITERMGEVLDDQAALLRKHKSACQALEDRASDLDDALGPGASKEKTLRPVEEALDDAGLQGRHAERTMSEFDEGYWSSGTEENLPNQTILERPPNFRSKVFQNQGDRLFLEGKFDDAVKSYRKQLVGLDALGQGDSAIAQDLASKLRVAKRARAGAQRMSWLADTYDDSAGAMSQRITKAEIDGLSNNPNVRFREMTGESVSSPYWVEEFDGKQWKRIGVLKQAVDPTGFDFKAERVYRDFAREVDLAVPECSDDLVTATVTKKMNDVDAEVQIKGLFVRNVDGTDLSNLDVGTRLALKKQVAEDRVMSALLGDYDRKMGNYLLAKDGKLVSIDHGMANLGRFQRDPDLYQSILEHGGPANEAAIVKQMQEGYFGASHWRQRAEGGLKEAERLGSSPKAAELAERSRRILMVEDAITFEDMAPMIDKIKKNFSDDKIAEILGRHLSGDELKSAIEVLKVRRENLDKVLQQVYRSSGDLIGWGGPSFRGELARAA